MYAVLRVSSTVGIQNAQQNSNEPFGKAGRVAFSKPRTIYLENGGYFYTTWPLSFFWVTLGDNKRKDKSRIAEVLS